MCKHLGVVCINIVCNIERLDASTWGSSAYRWFASTHSESMIFRTQVVDRLTPRACSSGLKSSCNIKFKLIDVN